MIVVSHELSHFLLLILRKARPSDASGNIATFQVIRPNLTDNRVEVAQSHSEDFCSRQFQSLALKELEQEGLVSLEGLIKSIIRLGKLVDLDLSYDRAHIRVPSRVHC